MPCMQTPMVVFCSCFFGGYPELYGSSAIRPWGIEPPAWRLLGSSQHLKLLPAHLYEKPHQAADYSWIDRILDHHRSPTSLRTCLKAAMTPTKHQIALHKKGGLKIPEHGIA